MFTLINPIIKQDLIFSSTNSFIIEYSTRLIDDWYSTRSKNVCQYLKLNVLTLLILKMLIFLYNVVGKITTWIT